MATTDAAGVLRDRERVLAALLAEVRGLILLLDPPADDEPACELKLPAEREVPRLGKPAGAAPRLGLSLKPKAAPPEPGGSRRHRIAGALAAGPKGLAAIAEELDIPKGTMPGLVAHPWFEKTGRMKRDPYRLTALGREQALASGTASATTT
jgi:hypothetical protein